MQFPITPGATYPETLGETPPGVIGNCICPGIAFGGDHEYVEDAKPKKSSTRNPSPKLSLEKLQ